MKTSSCPLEILPTFLFKSAIGSIGPAMLSIVNNSLLSGQVPGQFKQAVIQLLLKKKLNLDPSLPLNYRLISKLPFVAKIFEKVVAKQLTTAINGHNNFDKYQSVLCHS